MPRFLCFNYKHVYLNMILIGQSPPPPFRLPLIRKQPLILGYYCSSKTSGVNFNYGTVCELTSSKVDILSTKDASSDKQAATYPWLLLWFKDISGVNFNYGIVCELTSSKVDILDTFKRCEL